MYFVSGTVDGVAVTLIASGTGIAEIIEGSVLSVVGQRRHNLKGGSGRVLALRRPVQEHTVLAVYQRLPVLLDGVRVKIRAAVIHQNFPRVRVHGKNSTPVGPQGIGKSTIFARLADPWFSDSLTITDMKDKTAAEKLSGNLIVEISELAGMRKAEAEPVKGFISRTEDKFRPAYGRTVETFPRQCIIVGSTNAEEGFLRDPTGGRRWWPVPVKGQTSLRAHDLDQPTINQIWAEARHYDKQGETLYLTGTTAADALEIQAASIEADDRTGLVVEYLNQPLPKNWEAYPLGIRRIYLDGSTVPEQYNHGNGFGGPTYVERETVSKIEIWSECFGRDPDAMRKQDSHEISAIMAQLDDWEDAGNRKKLSIYGQQRVYRKVQKVAAEQAA